MTTRGQHVAIPADDGFPDELGTTIEAARLDPEFVAAHEDATERHAILDRLVKCRLAHGLTQSEVAGRMGVTQPTVSGFETESSDPRISTLQRYARAVGCSVKLRVDMPAHTPWLVQGSPYASNELRPTQRGAGASHPGPYIERWVTYGLGNAVSVSDSDFYEKLPRSLLIAS